MASRVGGVVQENSSVGRKINDVVKGPRKGVLGGRTPLGDLSNAQRRSLNQASKKHNSSVVPLFEKETGASQKKKTIGLQSGRKALSDISNSGRSNLNEGPKINNVAKLSVLEEETIDVDDIAGERFLHNHQECIKARSRAMDLKQFLQTIGLDSDRNQDKETPMPFDSPPRQIELEEMDEEFMPAEKSLNEFSIELDSPPPVRSPTFFEDYDYEFELKASP